MPGPEDKRSSELDCDTLLMLRVSKNDDREAFQQVYRKYYSVLASFFRKVRRIPAHTCEDMIQDVFHRVWRDRKQFRGQSMLFTYLLTIAKCVAVDYLRGTRLGSGVREITNAFALGGREIEDRLIHDQTPPILVHREEIRQEVHKAVSLLPADQKQSVELVWFEALPQVKAAQEACCARKTLRKRLGKALTQLARSLARLMID